MRAGVACELLLVMRNVWPRQATAFYLKKAMKIHYLENVTSEVAAVCAAYAAANGVRFGRPDDGLGNARTPASQPSRRGAR